MSAPPISSPLTKTCGIVGQSESAESSCRICGSGRMSTAVIGAPAFQSAWSARMRVAARRPLGRALHEDRDGLVVDHVLDLVAERHAGPFVVMRSSWIVPSASGAASARLTRRCCSTSESPSNAALATVTWKWSPPPVRSTTSTVPSGNACCEERADRVGRHRR